MYGYCDLSKRKLVSTTYPLYIPSRSSYHPPIVHTAVTVHHPKQQTGCFACKEKPGRFDPETSQYAKTAELTQRQLRSGWRQAVLRLPRRQAVPPCLPACWKLKQCVDCPDMGQHHSRCQWTRQVQSSSVSPHFPTPDGSTHRPFHSGAVE